ncbi:LemA family protein [Candidatus Parabeggiatoa sp. HSG14]|uniref:LemA family protein n=1 Tax=Candidatus Parabeggiatoa sp. HSG14 TaxID=3055593 RepID=UPI0025A7756F|nr:LemA family protein [Thiotrichales bacterium HSG14]
MSSTLIIIVVLVVVAITVLVIYNSIIGRKNQVEYAFGGIEVMLKKRYDLIPNLVKTVQGYATHERELLEKITTLRTQALKGNLSNDEKVELNNQMSGTLGQIMVAVESYPELKANENFLHLQSSLNEVEEQISASRRAYNAAVNDFNNSIEMFPGSVMAGMMNFKRKKGFEISNTERQNVNVNFE